MTLAAKTLVALCVASLAVACTPQADKTVPQGSETRFIATIESETFDAAETLATITMEGPCLRLEMEEGRSYTPVFVVWNAGDRRRWTGSSHIPMGIPITLGGAPAEENAIEASLDPQIRQRCGGPYFIVGSIREGSLDEPMPPGEEPGGL